MIVIRAVQGIGGAILSPATLTIIVTTSPASSTQGHWRVECRRGRRRRGRRTARRHLTGWASWRWVFFINVPFGIVAGTVAAMYLREMRNRGATTKLDVTGSVLVTGGLASAIYAVVNTTTHRWDVRHDARVALPRSHTVGGLRLLGSQGGVAPAGSLLDLQVPTAHHGQSDDVPYRRVVLRDVVLLDVLLQGVLGYGPGESRLRLLPDGPRHHHRCTDLVADSVQDRRATVIADRRGTGDLRVSCGSPSSNRPTPTPVTSWFPHSSARSPWVSSSRRSPPPRRRCRSSQRRTRVGPLEHFATGWAALWPSPFSPRLPPTCSSTIGRGPP